MKKALATLLGAGLIILSPGIECYRVFAQVYNGEAGAGVSTTGRVLKVISVVPQGTGPSFSGGTSASGNLKGGTDTRFDKKRAFRPVDPGLTEPSYSPSPEPGTQDQTPDITVTRDPYKIDEGKGVRDVYHNAVELQSDLANQDAKSPEAGPVALNRFFEKIRKPETVSIKVPSAQATYIKEGLRSSGLSNGIAERPVKPAAPAPASKAVETAKTVGKAAVVVAAIAAAAYGVVTAGHAMADWLGNIEFNLRHMSTDPSGFMMMGAGALGLGMARETARLQNPKEHYPAAYKAAEKAAAEMGVKPEDLVFLQANGSMEPRSLSWLFEFRAPAAEGKQDHITVQVTRNVVGGWDQKVLTYKDAPASTIEEGQTARKLEPYYFSRGAEMSPDTALMFSQNKVKGFLAKTFTLALHTDAATGDQDLHYTFYADDGAVVRINARTADAKLVRGPPASPSLWSRLKSYVSFGGNSGQAEINIPIFIAFVAGVPTLGVWFLTSVFAMSAPAAFLVVAGFSTFAALVFFRGAGGQNSAGSAMIGMAIGGMFAAMAVASLLGSGIAWLMAHVTIHAGAASLASMPLVGLAIVKSGDPVAAFRKTIRGLSIMAQSRLAGTHPGEMAEGLVEDVRYYQKLYDVTPDDPAAQEAVNDVQAFLAALPMVLRKLAVDNPSTWDFRKAVTHFYGDLQFAADKAANRQELLVAVYAALAPKNGLRSESGPASNGVAEPSAPRERSTSLEVIGKAIAVGLALAPAALAYYFLAPASLLGYAAMAQSAPIILFALAPKTKSRALLTLPGLLGLGMAVSLAMSGSWVVAIAAAVNAAGMIHYAILSTKSDASSYRDEERGLVTYFTALLNAAGFAGYAAFSGWHAGLTLAAPALTFFILAANKAYDFKLKFFTSWGLGFARGLEKSMPAVWVEFGRWWRSAARGEGAEDLPWTAFLGYPVLLAYGALEAAVFIPVTIATALVYGSVSAFEKAFEDTLPDSYAHRFFAHWRDAIGSGLASFVYGNGAMSSLSENLFKAADALWARSNFITAPLGAVVLGAGRVFQALEWAVGGAISLVAGVLYAAYESFKTPAPAFNDESPREPAKGKGSKNPPVAVFGKYVALLVSAIPAGLGYFLTGSALLPALGNSLLLSSGALAVLALFSAKDSRLLRILPMIPVGGIGVMLTNSLGVMTMPALGLGVVALANLIGLVNLERLRSEKDSHVDREGVKAMLFLSTLLLATSPALLGLNTAAGLGAAAVSTGALVISGAYRFKGLFWDGLTEGFIDGLGEAVGESLHRTIWWHDLLSFWKGGSWVAVLGALPVFLFYAVEGVAGFVIGLGAAFVWAPLKALEGGFASAAKDGAMHGFFSRYNAYLSKSVKAFGDLPSEPVFKGVRALLGSPNLLSVPSGLVLLLVGQVLQLAGTAFGTVWGLLAGLIVAVNPAKK